MAIKIIRLLTAVIFIPLLISSQAESRIVYVPGEWPTIQLGIDNTSEGDTVMVERGLYVENVVIDYHMIVLASEFLLTGDTSYISQTIIDGDSTGSAIHVGVWPYRDTGSVVTGFTIRNGGGGYGGGGIMINGNPIITHNVICNNSATRGGGIYISGSPFIENNIIRDNHVTVAGGGIVSYGGACTILNNVIINNTSVIYGGGIHIEDSFIVTVQGNIISYNNAHDGGGLNFYAEGLGGVVTFNQITRNTAEQNSAIVLSHANYTFTNNTIADNSYNENGIIFYPYSQSFLTNNILWNNAANEIFIWEGGDVEVIYCNVSGGWEGLGNIDSEPLFCNPEENDYTLASNSPCISAGYGESNIGAFGIGCEATGIIDDFTQLPSQPGLSQNYPNPFNAKTSISFELQEPSQVNIDIYNMLGEKVNTVLNNYLDNGIHSVIFDGSNLPTGVYFYKLRAGDYSKSRQMLLLK